MADALSGLANVLRKAAQWFGTDKAHVYYMYSIYTYIYISIFVYMCLCVYVYMCIIWQNHFRTSQNKRATTFLAVLVHFRRVVPPLRSVVKHEASAALARLGGKVLTLGTALLMIPSSSGTHAPTPFAFQHQVDILDSGDSDDKAKKVWQPTNALGHTSIQLGSWPLDFLGVPMMRNINRCLKTCLLLHHASWAKTTVAKDNIAEAALALEQACLCRVLSWNVTVRFKTPTILTA